MFELETILIATMGMIQLVISSLYLRIERLKRSAICNALVHKISISIHIYRGVLTPR